MATIIIIDQMYSTIIPQLESLGYTIDYQPDISRAQLEENIHRYHGLVVRSKTEIDGDLLANALKLQFVARAGAGVDNLQEDVIRERGIHMINAPEGNRDTLGEHVVGMLLNLLHRITEASESVSMGHWDREGFRGTELKSKTVGIIGCGNMGCAVAVRLSSFGCRILGYDKYLTDENSSDYEHVTLQELFDQCDIVSLHVPLTSETRGFYNYSFFHQFKKHIILLNSARGEILPLDDLVQLVKEEKIQAAALDVFEKEPLSQLSNNQNDVYQFLTSTPSIILTPHIGGWSFESYKRINQVLVDKIKGLQDAGLIH